VRVLVGLMIYGEYFLEKYNYTVTDLKIIPHEKGDVYHGLRVSDIEDFDFGELYFTSVHKGVVKGWKKHQKMVLNLIVVKGTVRFYLKHKWEDAFKAIDLGVCRYARLEVLPEMWVAFKGLDNDNLIANCASIEHDPGESVNRPF
jgi:dTDP-4-dehydrorhamnose 3,5-epimerase